MVWDHEAVGSNPTTPTIYFIIDQLIAFYFPNPLNPPYVGGLLFWGTPPNPWQEMILLHLFVKLTSTSMQVEGCIKAYLDNLSLREMAA
jgi:hypothetical protein